MFGLLLQPILCFSGWGALCWAPARLGVESPQERNVVGEPLGGTPKPPGDGIPWKGLKVWCHTCLGGLLARQVLRLGGLGGLSARLAGLRLADWEGVRARRLLCDVLGNRGVHLDICAVLR